MAPKSMSSEVENIELKGKEKRLFANFGAHSAQLQNSLRKFYIKC